MEKQRILVAGGTGLVGKVLLPMLLEKGYEVGVLSRNQGKNGTYRSFVWDPDTGYVDPKALAFADVIIHLAGANVAHYWTESYKKKITESSTQTNAILLAACERAGRFPKLYLSAGGMNYYGESGDAWRSELDPAGKSGFLPKSCIAWEDAVNKWALKGVRTVQFRISLVLSMKGGALPKMLMTAPAGIFPVFGNGQQWYSWVHIEDLAAMFLFALENNNVIGIYNAASPQPHRLKDFLKQCAKTYQIGGWYPSLPTFLVKILLGEMSETVLTSIRLSVDRLEKAGFAWKYPNLEAAVSNLREKKE